MMDRRNFLKVLGAVSVAPAIVAKAITHGQASPPFMTATRAMMEERDRLYFGSCRSGKTDLAVAQDLMNISRNDHVYDCLAYSLNRSGKTEFARAEYNRLMAESMAKHMDREVWGVLRG